MIGPGKGVINEFAKAFAQKGKGKGLTKEELLSWFARYSNNVVDPEFYGVKMPKEKLFHHCLEKLYVEDQYLALIDLCREPPESKNALPSEEVRTDLLQRLLSTGEPTPLTPRLLELGPWEVKRQWLKVVSRIESSPAAAITSARTLLEQACRHACDALNADVASAKGDLSKLIKAAKKALGLDNGSELVLAGMSSMVNGLAQRSNNAGDRHASAGIVSQVTATEARLFANLAASIAIFLLEDLHLAGLARDDRSKGNGSERGDATRADQVTKAAPDLDARALE